MQDPPDRPVLAERKLVTALFCDLVGSTALAERLDPEAMGRIQAAYFERVGAVVEQHGGTVEKFIGDAVVAVFGVPRAHEDDGERAVRCALGMRTAVAGLNETLRPRFGVELTVRIGVDTGEAVVTGRTADAIATGDVLNTAARLEAAAAPGEILVGRDTMLLARGGVAFDGPRLVMAKGKTDPVEAWVPTGIEPVRARPRPALVGRAGELGVLGAALEDAVADRTARVVMVLGEPGIGKTRLGEEFVARAQARAAILRGACRSYGEDTTWRPLADVIRAHAGIAESDGPDAADQKLLRRLEAVHPPDEARMISGQLGGLVGAGRRGATSSGEILWAVRRLLEGAAGERPVLVLLDDLHWGSPTLLETIEELVETIAAVPLVLVCQGRTELRERMPGLLGTPGTTVLALDRLTDEESARLVGELGAASNEDASAIVGQAAGNPLFLEELAAVAEQQGTVDRVPRSIQALIAARLDLLPAEAKLASQAASVVGQVFWAGAVAAALEGTGDVAPALRALRTRGLIEEQPRSEFLGDRQFAFHHNLIHEVAAASLPKGRRAEMHGRVARWMTAHAERRPELWSIVAHHWEQALALAAEIEPLEEPDPAVAEAASSSLLAAGWWAQSNAALPESIDLLRRALAVSRGSRFEHLSAARLALELARAGASEEARAIAEGVPADAEDDAGATAAMALATVAKNSGSTAGIEAHAPRAVELARRAGALDIESQAVGVLAWASLWMAGGAEYAEAKRRWEESSELGQRAADLTLAARAKGYAGLAAVFMLDIAASDRLARESLELAERAGSIRAFVPGHTAASRTRQLQGRLEEALEHGREWYRLASEAGERLDAVAACAFGVAQPLLLLGRLEESWAATEDGLRIVGEMKTSGYEPDLRWDRIRLLLAWERVEDANAELDRSAPLYVGEDEQEMRLWQAAAAVVRAAQGRDEEAEGLWRRAIGPAEPDWFVVEAMIDFAGFLVDRGRPGDARPVVARLGEVVEGTGATLLESQVEELKGRLAGR